MALLKRIEQRRLRHIFAPHGPGSSRATVTTFSDKLKQALYANCDHHTRKHHRLEFTRFLREKYDMPTQTAYGKLRLWSIEEWEVLGLTGLVELYCKTKDLPSPNTYAATTVDEAVAIVKQWQSTMTNKMKFYEFITERGMCREMFTRIMNGKTTLNELKTFGLYTAFCQWTQERIDNFDWPFSGIIQ